MTAGELYRFLYAHDVLVAAWVGPFMAPRMELVVTGPRAANALAEHGADIVRHRDMLMLLAIGQGVSTYRPKPFLMPF